MAAPSPGQPDASGQTSTPRSPVGTPEPGFFVPRRALPVAAGVLLVALLFGLWGAWRTLSPAPDDMRAELSRAQGDLERVRAELAAEQQKSATLSRSDQISRDANRELQGALAARDE